ncbi:MAG: nuclear transport factor 2 family protein [Chitinophagaceae bacterium]|jgi:ketosteroid isomerase-like protein|nr:nuclear transport factor 2 family protein [Chitinophagaceae bacterium]
MKQFMIALAMCTVCTFVSGQKQPSSINGFAESEKEKKAILDTREGWRKAFESRSVEGMMQFYVHDIISYDLMAPIQFEGERMWRDNWINFFKYFPKEIKITLEDLTVFQSGDLATIRGLTRLQAATADGRYVDMWTRETNVLRKINGTWLLVHDHVSVPMDFQNGMALTNLKPIEKK